MLTLLTHDDGRARILAHRQDAGRSDVGVLEQIERDEFVVWGCLGILENGLELSQVARPKKKRDVTHGLTRQQREAFAGDVDETPASDIGDVNMV